MEGKKFDQGKAPMSLIPYEFLEGVAMVLKLGASKYGAYNWASGMDFSRLISAAYRHLGQFEAGENLDEESGKSHLLHATCCLLFLYMYQLLGLGTDDRFIRPQKGQKQ